MAEGKNLCYSTIAITLDTYSHVASGLQEAVANRFDEVLKTTPMYSIEPIHKYTL